MLNTVDGSVVVSLQAAAAAVCGFHLVVAGAASLEVLQLLTGRVCTVVVFALVFLSCHHV